MKWWHLPCGQLVTYSRHRICFCDKHNDLALYMDQFWNLNDIVRINPLQRQSYPLGRGLWLKYRKGNVYIQSSKICFLFKGKSWSIYKNIVHWKILSFLRHDREQQRHRRRRNPSHQHTRMDSTIHDDTSVTSPSPPCSFSFKKALRKLRNDSSYMNIDAFSSDCSIEEEFPS